MDALLLDGPGGPPRPLRRRPLGSGLDERWLQALLFEQPRLVPLEDLEPGAGVMLPVCRELPIARPGGAVFLDLLGVTGNGRLVLVECKLWRNPQARREVVAQILEYAALLRRWTYADLTARLRACLGSAAADPLYEIVRSRLPGADQARFVDAVSRCLRAGDFQLVVAGDGIREDVSALAEHVGGFGARLALVEFRLWSDDAGRTVVVPHVPFRTEVVRQRVLVDQSGAPVATEDEDAQEMEEAVADPGRAAARARNRAFWDRFIAAARFDHPEQAPPRHAGDNWVRMRLPSPAKSLNAYRYRTRIGVFVAWEPGDPARRLEGEMDSIRRETGLEDLQYRLRADASLGHTISVETDAAALGGEDAQIAWAADAANRIVNALRPRLARMAA